MVPETNQIDWEPFVPKLSTTVKKDNLVPFLKGKPSETLF